MKPEQYKFAAIAAMGEIRDKYRDCDLEKHSYFSGKSCAMCNLYPGCKGCPINGKSVSGCIDLNSFENAYDSWHNGTPNMPQAFEDRAKFFDNLIEIAQEKPAEAFHPDTWEPWELDLNF